MQLAAVSSTADLKVMETLQRATGAGVLMQEIIGLADGFTWGTERWWLKWSEWCNQFDAGAWAPERVLHLDIFQAGGCICFRADCDFKICIIFSGQAQQNREWISNEFVCWVEICQREVPFFKRACMCSMYQR